MSNFKFEKKSSRDDVLLGATNTETGETYYFVKLSIGELSYLPTDIGATDSEGFEQAIKAVKETGKLVHRSPDAHPDAIDP